MGLKDGVFRDDEAVSTTVGYILMTGVALIFLAIIMVTCVSIFVDNPSRVVMRSGFTDVGNAISTKIVDVYIVCPDNGTLTSVFTLPAEIGGSEYKIDASIGTGQDQMVEVSDLSGKVTVRMTINGIAESVSVSGSTMSGKWEHEIHYNSS